MLHFMETFKDFITERYVNLLPHQKKERELHAGHLLNNILKPSYEKIGGIHGTGFDNEHDIVNNTSMWKLHRHKGKIVAGSVYKSKPGMSGGRKLVAVGSDGTVEGRRAAGKMMVDDLIRKRSHAELSNDALTSLKKNLTRVGADLKDHTKTYEEAKTFHNRNGDEIRRPPADDENIKRHPEFTNHFYQRKIGGEWHTKLLVGTEGKHIT